MDEGLQHPEHTGQELAVGDVTLYYEVHGVSSGMPLFALNGGPGLDHSYLEVSAVWQELAYVVRSSSTTSAATGAPRTWQTVSLVGWPTNSPTSMRCGSISASSRSTCSAIPWMATLPWPTRRATRSTSAS